MPLTLKRNEYDALVKTSIIELLKSADGLTITEMARILDIHYTTASKYLAVLEAEGKVFHRDIGMAKLFKLSQDYNRVATDSSVTFVMPGHIARKEGGDR